MWGLSSLNPSSSFYFVWMQINLQNLKFIRRDLKIVHVSVNAREYFLSERSSSMRDTLSSSFCAKITFKKSLIDGPWRLSKLENTICREIICSWWLTTIWLSWCSMALWYFTHFTSLSRCFLCQNVWLLKSDDSILNNLCVRVVLHI